MTPKFKKKLPIHLAQNVPQFMAKLIKNILYRLLEAKNACKKQFNPSPLSSLVLV
jgi:hypothetical protein